MQQPKRELKKERNRRISKSKWPLMLQQKLRQREELLLKPRDKLRLKDREWLLNKPH
jgi:hypothetical protein